ncbi:MAG TPA: hypothetical protein VE710_21360 [Candidatus Bathyarchaeia archaeon]|nr:hypothetical protein [Candidatus Bathyarchaeia archaeon]
MKNEKPAPRPDTSKNGLLKRNQLQVKDESVRARGKEVLSRLGKGKKENQE